MDTLTIKRGDMHDVRLTIGNAPMDLSGGIAKVHVKPSLGDPAETVEFGAVIEENVVVWTLDGTLLAGRYLLEVQVTVSGWVVTAPSDKMMTLIVLGDLA